MSSYMQDSRGHIEGSYITVALCAVCRIGIEYTVSLASYTQRKLWIWDGLISITEEVDTFRGRKIRFLDTIYILSRYVLLFAILIGYDGPHMCRLTTTGIYISILVALREEHFTCSTSITKMLALQQSRDQVAWTSSSKQHGSKPLQ